MKRIALAGSLAGAAMAVALAAAPAGGQQPAVAEAQTEAASLKLLDAVCGSCHTRGSILGSHRTKQHWEEVLDWMLDEGAVMSDAEFAQMLGYLSVRYGRVDVSAAPVEELRSVLELTQGQAERIVSARTAGRRLATLKDVAEVADVPADFVEARKARIEFGR